MSQNAELFQRGGRWISLVLGIAVLFCSALTLISLFFETHPLIPESFTPWSELGCSPIRMEEYRDGVVPDLPQFVCVTECGRGYIAKTPRDPSPQGDASDFTIRDLWSNRILDKSRLSARYSHHREIFSSTKRFLFRYKEVHQGEVNQPVLQDLIEHKESFVLTKSDKNAQISVNKSRNVALVRTDDRIAMWDLEAGIKISSIERPRSAISFSFCGHDGRPKCLTFANSVEVWDESASTREFVFSGQREGDGRPDGFMVSSDSRAIMLTNSSDLSIWSLVNGALLYFNDSSRVVRGSGSGGSAIYSCELDMTLSNDSRWLLVYRRRRHDPLIDLVDKLNSLLGEYRLFSMNDEQVAELIELNTKTSWSGLPYVQAAAFSEDDSRLATFCDAGKYEWSVPPRRQRVTHCGWAAIVGWVSLFAVWCVLRRMRRAKVFAA